MDRWNGDYSVCNGRGYDIAAIIGVCNGIDVKLRSSIFRCYCLDLIEAFKRRERGLPLTAILRN